MHLYANSLPAPPCCHSLEVWLIASNGSTEIHSLTHTHTERSTASTHQTPHWLRKREIQGHGHYELWFDLPFVLVQLQRLRCWRRRRRSQSQRQMADAIFVLNWAREWQRRYLVVVTAWYRYLLHNQHQKRNQKKKDGHSHTRTLFNLCVRKECKESRLAWHSYTSTQTHTHAQTAHSAGYLINYIAHNMQVNFSATRKCDSNDNYYCDQLLWSAMLSRC